MLCRLGKELLKYLTTVPGKEYFNKKKKKKKKKSDSTQLEVSQKIISLWLM